jgi:hypothetical protein
MIYLILKRLSRSDNYRSLGWLGGPLNLQLELNWIWLKAGIDLVVVLGE